MFLESLQSLRKQKVRSESVDRGGPSLYVRLVQALPWQMTFPKSGVTLSAALPLVLGCSLAYWPQSWELAAGSSWFR